jgi:hypothetical protein
LVRISEHADKKQKRASVSGKIHEMIDGVKDISVGGKKVGETLGVQ